MVQVMKDSTTNNTIKFSFSNHTLTFLKVIDYTYVIAVDTKHSELIALEQLEEDPFSIQDVRKILINNLNNIKDIKKNISDEDYYDSVIELLFNIYKFKNELNTELKEWNKNNSPDYVSFNDFETTLLNSFNNSFDYNKSKHCHMTYEKMLKFLDKEGISYLEGYVVPYKGSSLKYDLYLDDYNVLLDVNNMYQIKKHKNCDYPTGGDLKNAIQTELLKKEYCLNDNIKYVSIPYNTQWELAIKMLQTAIGK